MAKKSTKYTWVDGIVCPKCQDFIYSVHVHDFHGCSCGCVFIDGGFDYNRLGFLDSQHSYIIDDIKRLKVKIDKSKEELIYEYQYQQLHQKRQSGIIRAGDQSEMFKLLYLEDKKVK